MLHGIWNCTWELTTPRSIVHRMHEQRLLNLTINYLLFSASYAMHHTNRPPAPPASPRPRLLHMRYGSRALDRKQL